MHPVLFEIGSFKIYTYGVMVCLGAIASLMYLTRQSQRQFNVPQEKSNNLFLVMLVSAIIGGKLFMIFENPSYFFENPSALLSRGGFVFYGSLLTAIPFMLWYFKKMNAPTWGMLDIIAGVACIVHGIGRLGCLFAGCCHGVPTDSALGITFTDPACVARPLNTPLHPTQLYASFAIGLIFLVVLFVQAKKKFHGQVFLTYLILYSIVRSIIEVFRGDEARGYVFGSVTNSQFISALVISFAIIGYIVLSRKHKLPK